MTWFPKATDVLALHEDLVALFAREDNPIFPPGPKDLGLLESACTRPRTSLGKTEKYSSVEEKAAALLHSLVKNHAFHNGNKRTGLLTMMTFLWRNDRRLSSGVTDDEIFDLVMGVTKNEFPRPSAKPDPDKVVRAVAEWLSRRVTALTAKPAGMHAKDFLTSCERAGVKWKESGASFVVWKGSRSIRFSRKTRKLDGPVVRAYLSRLGLYDVRVDEFQEGLSPEQAVTRAFRNVLRRLAHA